MGLSKTINTDFGIQVVDAFHKITRVTADENAQTISLQVETYTSENAYEEGKSTLDIKNITISGESYLSIKAKVFSDFYTYLKTLPDFEGATDA